MRLHPRSIPGQPAALSEFPQINWHNPDRKSMGRLLAAFERTNLHSLGQLRDYFTTSDGDRINVGLLLFFFSLTQERRRELAHSRKYGEFTLCSLEMPYVPTTADVLLKMLLQYGVINHDLTWNIPPPLPEEAQK